MKRKKNKIIPFATGKPAWPTAMETLGLGDVIEVPSGVFNKMPFQTLIVRASGLLDVVSLDLLEKHLDEPSPFMPFAAPLLFAAFFEDWENETQDFPVPLYLLAYAKGYAGLALALERGILDKESEVPIILFPFPDTPEGRRSAEGLVEHLHIHNIMDEVSIKINKT